MHSYIELSRLDAREKGLKRYFDGLPCKYGHIAERYTCNTRCVACQDRFKTPSKIIPSGSHGLPQRALLFMSKPTPTAQEMHAAFRYIEAAGWHDAAIKALRDDPALMERFELRLTGDEYFKLEAQYLAAKKRNVIGR